MTTVEDLLKMKGREVVSISPQSTVFEALELMAEKDVGALVAMEGDQVVGMFSERDYARRIILQGRSSKITRVGDLMARKVFFSTPEKSIYECMALMTEKRIRHVPIMSGTDLVGVISIGDVVNQIIREQQVAINDLENYIIGGYGSKVVER